MPSVKQVDCSLKPHNSYSMTTAKAAFESEQIYNNYYPVWVSTIPQELLSHKAFFMVPNPILYQT